MKTVDGYLTGMEAKTELPELIQQSGVFRIPFHQKRWTMGRKRVHSIHVKRADWFWQSLKGIEFRLLLEKDAGYRFSKIETAQIKSALAIYFMRHFPEDGDPHD